MNPGSSTQADDYSPSAPSEGIIGGLNFRKSLHAEGVDLSDPVLEGDSLDLILYVAIREEEYRTELKLISLSGSPSLSPSS